MRRLIGVMVLVLTAVAFTTSHVQAQSADAMARIRAAAPFSTMQAKIPGLTYQQYEAAVRQVALSQSSSPQPTYLGRLSTNPYSSESTSNPYSTYGSPYSSRSIQNPYSTYGNPYSPKSVTNPYTTGGPKLYGQDGTYLGRMNSNPYDPESISNPYGRYGSPYAPNGINNPYSRFGSPYSSYSFSNPYTTQAPIILDDDQ